MKRILGLAALLASAAVSLAGSYGIQAPQYRRQYGVKRTVRQGYRLTAPPTAVRWWHDRESPEQADRHMKASLKRQRKADKLFEYSARSITSNKAHASSYEQFHDELFSFVPNALNPFYVAK